MSEEYNAENRSGASWQLPAIIVLGLVAVGGLAFGWNATSKLDATQQQVASQVSTLKTGVEQDMSSLKDRLVQDEKTNADLQGDLKVVTDKLKITQGQLKKARAEAAKAVADTSDKLTALDTNVHTELATKAANDDLKTVDTKVVGVRTDLDSTQNDLKMARSELGTLIARNHEDVEQLRRLGERDYIEFSIDAKNKPQKVGAFVVELRGTNPNKKRYNVALIVDDSRIERKNLPVNEPIFFHQGNDRRPLELVVNSVAKDKVTGYISVPKAAAAQSASSD